MHSSDWLPLVKKRFKLQVGGAFVFTHSHLPETTLQSLDDIPLTQIEKNYLKGSV